MKTNLGFRFQTQADPKGAEFEPQYLRTLLEDFKKTAESGSSGFFRLSDDRGQLESAKEMREKHRDKKHFVQIGIGGSALGPQALLDALKSDKDTRFFFMDNTDSEYIQDTLAQVDPKKALFYVVSKSGGTAETMANFSIARNFLRQAGIPQEQFHNHFVLCTDPRSGHLRQLAQEEGLDSLEVPSDTGGRFSVLSHVGLFPALFAGVDIDALYEGANEIKASLLEDNLERNPLLNCAAHIFHLYQKGTPRANQTVFMPYSSKLKTLSAWFVQLWGESLGKIRPSDGANTGLTPIPAYGATDQHSQMQLFMEGPSDKVLILLEVKNRESNFGLDSGLELEPAQKLAPYNLNQLIEAQINGTLQALKDKRKNVIHISIERNDAFHMGALILFFESLTAVMGDCLGVDPFNQPGVELGKKYAYEYLKSLPQSADK